MRRYVFGFGIGSPPSEEPTRELLGGKGYGLANMAQLGLRVPPGFTITTEACNYFYAHDSNLPAGLKEDAVQALRDIEKVTGRQFGGDTKSDSFPLLVSVRSGARASMPGMMDTILNLGLNDRSVEQLARATKDRRFALDCYRRFIQMYSQIVLGMSHDIFEGILERAKHTALVELDSELSAKDLEQVVAHYKDAVTQHTKQAFPQDPHEQLWNAVGAVFRSWMNQRAVDYRALHDIPQDWGTAVNVQAMVYGNKGADCATGVAFTRDPNTGALGIFGEFLPNAQGEDVVSGTRDAHPISEAGKRALGSAKQSLEELMPDAYRQLADALARLEQHHEDMQDTEFTIEGGMLWMLQTRTGKRSAQAAITIAVNMAEEGLITREDAVARITPRQIDELLHPRIDPSTPRTVLAKGLPASPGAVSGEVAFDAATAIARAATGASVILIRKETSPDDFAGMAASKGIATCRGGMTSHAAVVARGMNRPCIVGASSMQIDIAQQRMMIGTRVVSAGDIVTLDGISGEILLGTVPTTSATPPPAFHTLLEWADALARLGVWANAETVEDVTAAVRLGAKGIGLARYEHMNRDSERTLLMRELIVANDTAGRTAALLRLLPLWKADFIQMFRILDGKRMTIRLNDWPLNEFAPKTGEDFADLSLATGLSAETLRKRVSSMEEENPMLGLRACRLGIIYPEIFAIQVRAIIEAAIETNQTSGKLTARPDIMLPLVMNADEMKLLGDIVTGAAHEAEQRLGKTVPYEIGTMIELPAAALAAGEIAKWASFFSFGTNDLTQTTLGLSRDDAGTFLPQYLESGLLKEDPFVTIAPPVRELVSMAMKRAASRPGLKAGVCGEHGGDPASIAFFHTVGLDYVSCSPYRVPVARLAAAHAAMKVGDDATK